MTLNDNRTLAYITSKHDDRFGSIQAVRSFCIDFFEWYNTMHHHGSLGLLTPFDVHYGLAAKRTEQRALVFRKAFAANPDRFVRGAPKPPAVPKEVWIKKPRTRNDEPDALDLDS